MSEGSPIYDPSNESFSMSNQSSESLGQSNTTEKELTDKQRIEQLKNELFNKKTPDEYEPIIGEKVFIEIGTKYAENLIKRLVKNNELTELGQLLANEIKGKRVLDLGCGKSESLNAFSQENGADLYVGVDLYPNVLIDHVAEQACSQEEEDEALMNAAEGLDNFIAKKEGNKEEMAESSQVPEEPEYKIQDRGLQVKDDMLRAISTIKSSSMKLVIVSGIETFFDGHPEADKANTEKYINALQNEIKRVLTEDGLFLNYESNLSLEGSNKVEVGGYVEGVDLRRNNKVSESA